MTLAIALLVEAFAAKGTLKGHHLEVGADVLLHVPQPRRHHLIAEEADERLVLAVRFLVDIRHALEVLRYLNLTLALITIIFGDFLQV